MMLRHAYRWVTRLLKLSYLWVVRILFAPNHFGVSLPARLKWAVCGGYMVDQVALYRLDEGTCDEYLSEFDWYRSRDINRPYDLALNNKVLCAQLLAPLTTVPEVLFFTRDGHIVCPEAPERWASPDEVLAVLAERGRAFIKPISSGKGKGVHLLACADGAFSIDGSSVSRERMREEFAGDDWHLCAFAEQSAFLRGIYPHASNTIRAITLRDRETGAYRMLFAVLRIGTSETGPVDNGSRGGLVAKIDLESGALSEARSIQRSVHFARHPDTGAPIQGERIPNWRAVRKRVVALAERLPFLDFIAWDILLSDEASEGFTVIEANASSGVNIVQIWGGQRHGELGAFYRSHGVIR